MRIGLVAPPWIPVPPPAYGGTESVIDNLARGLRRLGHEVVLFTVGDSTSPVERIALFDHGVEPIGQSVAEAAHVVAAYDALRDVDVIHDHTMLGPLLAARAGLPLPPVVTTNHGPFTDLTVPLFRAIARGAWVVAISHDQARRARNVPIAAVIHHGIDLHRYREGPGGGDELVFVGRMSPDKGVADAVRVAHATGRPLRIVSKMREPAERAYFDAAVRPLLSGGDVEVEELGLDERVEVVGRAAGLVNPIAWPEPFGLVMAESLAVGTPVLARRRGAAPEIVTSGRTGFLFDDVAAGARAVADLVALDRRHCRQVAESHFSLERMAREHERFYERILAGPPLPAPRRSGRARGVTRGVANPARTSVRP